MNFPSLPRGAAGAVVLLTSCTALAAAASELGSDTLRADRPPRIRVDVGNAAEIDIRDCLRTAIDAANSEDLEGFVGCFAGSRKARMRTPAAIRFVQHDVSMELVDVHVVKAGTTRGEAAVKYRVVLSNERFDVVSLVALKQENGSWRIDSEKIQSYEHWSPSRCSPSRYACLGAACRFASP